MINTLTQSARCLATAAVCFIAWCSSATSASPQTQGSQRHLTTEELVRTLGADKVARLFAEASEKAHAAPFSIEVLSDSVVLFRGPITSSAAESLVEVLSSGRVRELRVDSIGGSIDAGIRIGHLIRKLGIHVIVQGLCVSSCANYLFAAGVARAIAPGAVVVWHGNAFQKTKREFAQCGRTTSSFDGLPFVTAHSPRREALAHQFAQRQAMETDFAQTVGVDDYVARVGQEPKFFGNFTMSVANMSKFGLHDVEAPPDYGSKAFCDRARKEHDLPLHCIEVTDQMLAYERARRSLGEVCQPDGTLRIRTGRAIR